MGFLQKATVHDAAYIAMNLREADRLECDATMAFPPELVLPQAVAEGHRRIWTGHAHTGEPVLICGVDPGALPELGVVWMVSTPKLKSHQIEFLRTSLPWIKEMNEEYPILHNYVDARNTLHHKWLRWCGFKLLRTVDRWGARSVPFIEFARINTTCA